MPYLANVEATLRGVQAGEICETLLQYHHLDYNPLLQADDFAAAVVAGVWDVMKPLVSEKFQMLTVKVVTRQHDTSGVFYYDEYTLDVAEFGTAIGGVLPPNVTVRIVKYVDNTTRLPLSAPIFRNGFAGFSGALEADQENGLLTEAAVTAWFEVANGMELITLNYAGTDWEYVLGLERQMPGEPDKVLVDHCSPVYRLGTRNSRKRR